VEKSRDIGASLAKAAGRLDRVSWDPDALAAQIESDLRAIGTAERAEWEKRYLKSELSFLGVTVWQTRAAAKAASRAQGLDHDGLIALVEALWATSVFDRRQAAVMLLELNRKLVSHADAPLLERLLRESGTWALVDGLAGDVVGGLNQADHAMEPILDRWATDPDFWIRRASLLAELIPHRAGAPLEPFLRRADAMLDEKEFFIRKAIGWVLREVAKKRSAEVVAWLAPRTARASGVTMREAVRYLPEGDRERLMAAYREKRAAS
jgi:3-methyladenine DNA glycosylase AlkD